MSSQYVPDFPGSKVRVRVYARNVRCLLNGETDLFYTDIYYLQTLNAAIAGVA